mmetsp:Transcript_65974/g.190317  ORF Transcript_65974/g.190317 Transcript_65974/m.190317 type:complete len:451 (+) Transcript_65974:61-1413(+)
MVRRCTQVTPAETERFIERDEAAVGHGRRYRIVGAVGAVLVGAMGAVLLATCGDAVRSAAGGVVGLFNVKLMPPIVGPAVDANDGANDDANDDGWVQYDPMHPTDPLFCAKDGVHDGVEFRLFTFDSPCGLFCCKRQVTTPAPTTSSTSPPPHRIASFLAVGDWGYDKVSHGWNVKPECQSVIAQRMEEEMQKLGDVRFVINVGDSFYPSGVASKEDPQWQSKWRDVFPQGTRSVPWYSVYGNHDYHIDPCICSDNVSQCAQVNPDEKNLDYFVMPNYTYFKEIPELDLEIIAMDTNQYMEGWNPNITREKHSFNDCQWTTCPGVCWDRAVKRANASFELFYDRMSKTTARNLIVFSHYPTDYYWVAAPEFLDALRTPARNITFFGGHRHSTDQWSVASIAPNNAWLVGGGGGWSCDSGTQGFVVGQVMSDLSVKTSPVIVDRESCCTGK